MRKEMCVSYFKLLIYETTCSFHFNKHFVKVNTFETEKKAAFPRVAAATPSEVTQDHSSY